MNLAMTAPAEPQYLRRREERYFWYVLASPFGAAFATHRNGAASVGFVAPAATASRVVFADAVRL